MTAQESEDWAGRRLSTATSGAMSSSFGFRYQNGAAIVAAVAMAISSTLIPASGRASCSGLKGADYVACLQAESEMIRRSWEDAAAARERTLIVEVGDEKLQTTEYEMFYSALDECRFLKRQGAFCIVDEDGDTASAGSCLCCTDLSKEGQEWVPRTRSWRLHGRYVRYRDKPPGTLQTDYWCGVETQRLNELHRRSIVEGCE